MVGVLATLTRLTGVFLAIALLWEYWADRKKIEVKMLACLVPLVGLGIYMWYLYSTFGDPLMFVNVQSEFGADRQTTKLVLLYQVFYRYAKMLMTVPLRSWTYYQVLLELGSAIFGVFGLALAYKWVRKSYVWYAGLAFLLPSLTGTFSSMPRYLLVLFPLFIAVAKIRSKYIRFALLTIFVLLQMINIILFTQGKWVA